MTFRAGVFTSNAKCTSADLDLEQQINARLERGRVVLWTLDDPHKPAWGMTFTYRGLHKVFTRRSFELDADEVAQSLAKTARGMENARLAPGWIYDEDEVDKFPDWVEDNNASV